MIDPGWIKMGLFATPESDSALAKYINNFNGSERVIAETVSAMTWNRVVDKLNEDPGLLDISIPEDEKSLWITVGNISVYVVRTDEGVCVDLYAKEAEDMDEAHLAGCYAFFDEATEPKSEEFDDGGITGHPV